MSGTQHPEMPGVSDAPVAGLPAFDADKYRNELQDLDLTEEEMVEFLRTIDFIMRTFVELGWGVDSVVPALLQGNVASLADESKREPSL